MHATASTTQDRNRVKVDAGRSAAEMLGAIGMSTRPEFYAGSGALEDDGHASSRNLARLHSLIKAEQGDDAAASFAHMVRQLPVLSGTMVLTNLYALEASGWRWQGEVVDTRTAERQGLGALAMCEQGKNYLGDENETATRSIRSAFLRRIGEQ